MTSKLRIFGGLVLLFNFWLIGQYRIDNIPTILMTFGFVIAYELVVVRSVRSVKTQHAPTKPRKLANNDKAVTRPECPKPTKPQKSPEEEMEELGISYNGEKYCYQEYKYDNLQDAINYARIQRSRSAAST